MQRGVRTQKHAGLRVGHSHQQGLVKLPSKLLLHCVGRIPGKSRTSHHITSAVCPDIGGLPSLTPVTHQSDADKNSINLRGSQGEAVQPCQRAPGAQHTASLPEMSAIIRTCTRPDGGNAKPRFIKRDNYVERRKRIYPKLANSATPPPQGHPAVHDPPIAVASFSALLV